MSTPEVRNGAWESTLSRPINEERWRAWVLRGLANERRTNARFVKSVKGIALAALLAAAALWSQVTLPTEAIAKFAVAGAAVVVLSQAVRARHYAIAAVFVAIALTFNPILPAFEFAGQWQHALVAFAAVLFAASLVWPTRELAHNA